MSANATGGMIELRALIEAGVPIDDAQFRRLALRVTSEIDDKTAALQLHEALLDAYDLGHQDTPLGPVTGWEAYAIEILEKDHGEAREVARPLHVGQCPQALSSIQKGLAGRGQRALCLRATLAWSLSNRRLLQPLREGNIFGKERRNRSRSRF